jgi:diacylglycerol kinase (ATP)
VPRRAAVLVNPAAGRGSAGRAAGPVVERLRSGRVQVDVLTGANADEAAALARSAVTDGVDTLVAVGGDGLVHVAQQAVVGTDVRLGIVPCGTGNDAARALGLPLGDPAAAVDVVLAARTRVVDLGRVGGRTFLAVLSSGFDSRVNERANRMTWVRGPGRYRVAMLAELGVFRPVPYRIELDGERLEVEAMLVAVGNGPSYGGGMRVCPAAALDDGLLEVTVVLPLAIAPFLRLFPSVYRGDHVRSAAVLTRQAQRVSLAAEGMTAYADGEPVGPLPVTVDVLPAALTVLVPAGSE